MRVGIVAGEASGDQLAAGLIQAIKTRRPEVRFEGVAGPAMTAAGCTALHSIESISVMGFSEVLRHLPRLWKLRGQLRDHFLSDPPDLFIGVDAPDFNLPLERALKARGIPTVHYVSPSVWAWRSYRVKRITASADLMLTLFPFEARFYEQAGMAVRFVGHPLADEIPDDCGRVAARAALGLSVEGKVLAVLPGSRRSEVEYLSDDFLAAAARCRQAMPGLQTVIPAATAAIRARLEARLALRDDPQDVRIVDGSAREVMCAADAILLASGTATLEALLLKRPMVVAYRMAAFSHWLVRRLSTVDEYSLPNNLGEPSLVPEFIQGDVTPQALADALLPLLQGGVDAGRQVSAFAGIHAQLRRDASASAAEAILEYIE